MPKKKQKQTGKQNAARASTSSASGRKLMTWEWSPRREHDGKSFGNAALYATPQTVASLVRETGQNSLDAGAEKRVVMRFRLIDLPAGCQRRIAFEKSVQFSNQLRPHLEAVAKSKKTQASARVASALAEWEDSSKMLRLLVVEDYGTKGLSGGEFDSDGSFSALIRDSENSHKADATAGGSFGLGSKTLWACSGLRTVIFASTLRGNESDGVRTIGKADLGYHEVVGGAKHGYVGPGFFGRSVGAGAAESIFLTDPKVLDAMCLRRDVPKGAGNSGTSALILGFDDPESDDEDSEQTLEKIMRSAAESFWPAIIAGALDVLVRHEVGDLDDGAKDRRVDPRDHVPSLVDAYRKHLAGEVAEKLKVPGDVVSVPIPHVVPATRKDSGVEPEHGEVEAEARLIIRLAEDDSSDPKELIDSVALARGRAMVTKYWLRRGIALNARPFHAFLLAGTLAGKDKNQVMAEHFLRHSEPPSHDAWKLSQGLKARYDHGAGKRIAELERRITQALAAHVAGSPEASDDGPDALKRLLAVPNVVVGKQSKWRLRDGTVEATKERLRFRAEFDIDRPEGVKFTPRISLAAESGTVSLSVEELSINGSAVPTGGLLLSKKDRVVSVMGTAVSVVEGIDLTKCAVKLSATLNRAGYSNVDE